jgi:hypothetical protein
MANSIEYAPATWENGTEETIPDFTDSTLPGKYKSTITNILSKHCTEVKLSSEELSQSLAHLSKKKLKELITKHNNDLFSFMGDSERASTLGVAETIFRRYGYDIPMIKGNDRHAMLKDLNLDASINNVVAEFDEGLKKIKGENALDDFMKQIRWIFQQYKQIGEEVLRLETTLFQKIDLLDKLHNRIPMITSLTTNDALPELIDSFSKYADSIYRSAKFEENYIELVEAYKKWNICRQIIAIQNIMRNDFTEPQCSICLTESISSAMVPCGHTFCGTCSRKQNTTCYICRGPIRERVKLFIG